MAFFASGALFSGGSTGMNAGDVPAGRTFISYKRADGSFSQAFIECPSLAPRVGGTTDPPCDDSFKNSFIAVAVLLAIEAGLLIGILVVGRSYRRLTRECKAVRRHNLAAGTS
ncbi:MAG: hypothetical protein HYX32_07655 [Actinobacteria bacterium]|nr:hypothetical protein [Actinomycetota bacterium]